MIDLTIQRGNREVPLHLPAAQEKISNMLNTLDGIEPAQITAVKSPVRNLQSYVRSVNPDDPTGMDTLNRLATRIGKLNSRECVILAGVLDTNSINGVDDVFKAVDLARDYTLLEDVTSYRELGGYLVEHGRLHCPEELKPYLDYRGIGMDFCDSHGGSFEAEGYVVRRCEMFPEMKGLSTSESDWEYPNIEDSSEFCPQMC